MYNQGLQPTSASAHGDAVGKEVNMQSGSHSYLPNTDGWKGFPKTFCASDAVVCQGHSSIETV
jgi:hypothetical protein